MEEGHLRIIKSQVLERKSTLRAIEEIKSQVEEAEAKSELKAANNPLIRAAIKVVEDFLIKTGRVCYGGQAINSLLPTSLKFYDTKISLPDYDVYTPNIQKDLRMILRALRKAGFPEIGHREGIHEGTIKVSVAFNDILDLTYMDPEIYDVLYKRSKIVNKIHNADANFLRSNMYKELSQPEGEIDRWEKVYTRLVILNEAIPPELCYEHEDGPITDIPKQLYLDIMNFIINNKRIFAGGNLGNLYQKKTKNYSWILKDTHTPIIFYSPDIENDISHLKILIGASFTMEEFEARGDVVPSSVIVYSGKTVVAVLVEERACYSYNKIPIQIGRELFIASLDTAIRLFYQLNLLSEFPSVVETSLHCVAQNLVDISIKIRSGTIQSQFPLFSIECTGHQQTKGSLIRAKKMRAKLRKLRMEAASTTRKLKK